MALRYSPKNEYALEKTNINLFSAFVISIADTVGKERELGEALARSIHVYSELQDVFDNICFKICIKEPDRSTAEVRIRQVG